MAQVTRLMLIVLLSSVLSSFVPAVAAQEGTPVTEVTDVTEETLFAWTIPAEALPTGTVEAVFYRLTLPAGVSLPLLAGPFCG